MGRTVVKPKRKRRKEYKRRTLRAPKKDLSRSRTKGQKAVGAKKRRQRTKTRAPRKANLQIALRQLQRSKSIAKAAKEAHISPERLRTYLIEKGVIEKRGQRLVLKKNLSRRLLVYSGGREHTITVDKSRVASLIGMYMAGVRWFLQTNNVAYLKPFADKSIKDSNGKTYLLETRPNVLHRLANSGGSSFEQIYHVVL